MSRFIYPIAEKTQLKGFSRFQKKRLLKLYRHRVYASMKGNNLFLNTYLPYFIPRMYKLSAGLIKDYANKKKRKKTYMAGFELSYNMGLQLNNFKVYSLTLFLKGHGAQKRGVCLGLLKNKLYPTRILDITPLAHNGTRACRGRRL